MLKVTEKDTAPQYVTLRDYAFEQTDAKIKVYLMGLEGIKACKDVKVTPVFNEKSFSIKIENLNGKHFQFGISNLEDTIVPESCSIKVKSNCILLRMKKGMANRTWFGLCEVTDPVLKESMKGP